MSWSSLALSSSLALASTLTLALASMPAPTSAPLDLVDDVHAARAQGRSQQVLPALDAALDADPGDPRLAGLLGLCLLDLGRSSRAAALAEQHRGAEGPPELLLFLGRQQLAQGKPRKAEKRLEAALVAEPDDVLEAEVLEHLVSAHRALDQHTRAVALARQLMERLPARGRELTVATLEEAGDRFIQRSERKVELRARALEMYSQALELEPDRRPLQLRLLNTLVAMYRADEAEPLVDELFPDREGVEWAFHRARCRAADSDGAGAEALLLTALQRDPHHAGARQELARLLVDRAAFDQAEDWIAPVAAAAPGQARPQLLLGLSLEGQGRFAEAEGPLRHALGLSPDHPEALYHLGRVLLRLGRAEEGRELLERFRKAGG